MNAGDSIFVCYICAKEAIPGEFHWRCVYIAKKQGIAYQFPYPAKRSLLTALREQEGIIGRKVHKSEEDVCKRIEDVPEAGNEKD